MSHPIIRVENLSKAYRIGLKEEIPDTFMSALLGWVRSPLHSFHRLRRLNTFSTNGRGDADDIVWALKDVSFDVQEGEVVGIIGRNGAGKSTLLKILSRITEPTAGRAVLRGRVSSLLEVGTGFHPELSGRENIYMNGTILGMTKREIDRKFDEIVDFSGVEKFLDTPVKRYSSGMKVRLAFSVAAHLEPEILIIDEVLAVGDAEFQKKCIGKMHDVACGGRTVLFVSHNMAAVQGLCTRAIWLDTGSVKLDSTVDLVVHDYHRASIPLVNERNHGTRARDTSLRFTVHEFFVFAGSDCTNDIVLLGTPITLEARCESRDELRAPVFRWSILTTMGQLVAELHSARCGAVLTDRLCGEFRVSCKPLDLLLAPGDYIVEFAVKDGGERLFLSDHAARFTVVPTDFFGTGKSPTPKARRPCVVTRQDWTYSTNGKPCSVDEKLTIN